MSKCNKCGEESDKCVWIQDFVKDFEYPLCRKCYGEMNDPKRSITKHQAEKARDRMIQRKMLGKDAHKALSDMTKKKLFPMMQTFHDVCLEDIVPDTKDDLIVVEEDNRDRIMEKLHKKLGPGPNFGGLITDPLLWRIRALEERMSKIESALFKNPSCCCCKFDEDGEGNNDVVYDRP